MKKILALALSACLTLFVCGCSMAPEEIVEFTIPASMTEYMDVDQISEVSSEEGIEVVTNDDGSITYSMPKSKHDELMNELRAGFDEQISALAGSSDYPTITEVTTNDDYTKFTVKTTSEELTLEESLLSLQLYMYGGFYNMFAGNTDEVNIKIDYINANTGDMIDSIDSANMAQAE